MPAFGCIEIGHVAFAPALRRTTAATEAIWYIAVVLLRCACCCVMLAQAAHENRDGWRRVPSPRVEVRPAQLAQREGGAEVEAPCIIFILASFIIAYRSSAAFLCVLIHFVVRFGFLYDGTFYENRVVRGRNRDTGGAA